METFLAISVIIFLLFGAVLLLAPKLIETITNATNKTIFIMESHLPKLRRPLGLFFLALSIFLWYIVCYKLG